VKINTITSEIIRAAMVVHSALGPGLLESVYQACLTHLLRQNGLSVDTERPIPVSFNGLRFELGFRLDMLVEEQVVVEVKAIRPHPASSFSATAFLYEAERQEGWTVAQLPRSAHAAWHPTPCKRPR
jgi:GxxExxY protein